MIHVNRGATSLGAFPEEEVREGLRTGRFASSDLGWREGMPSWKPLSQFSEFAAAAPAAPPPQIRRNIDSRNCRRAQRIAVGAPARTWIFQRIYRDARHGLDQTRSGLQNDEDARAAWLNLSSTL